MNEEQFKVIFKVDIGYADYLSEEIILTQAQINEKLTENYYSCVHSQIEVKKTND